MVEGTQSSTALLYVSRPLVPYFSTVSNYDSDHPDSDRAGTLIVIGAFATSLELFETGHV